VSRRQKTFEERQHARFMRPDAGRWLRPNAGPWLRPDAARFFEPGTDPALVHPSLGPVAMKYSPNQPRVPTGNGRESGQWTNGNGTGSVRSDDRRVVPDINPDTAQSYQQYAQNRLRGSVRVLINGQQFELTPAQGARLASVQARAEDAIARIRLGAAPERISIAGGSYTSVRGRRCGRACSGRRVGIARNYAGAVRRRVNSSPHFRTRLYRNRAC